MFWSGSPRLSNSGVPGLANTIPAPRQAEAEERASDPEPVARRYDESVEIRICSDPTTLARAAATVIRDRLRAKPDLAMAVPAGRTPRPMYAVLRDLHARAPLPFERMRVFSIDEL